jgi:hypothetical protein
LEAPVPVAVAEEEAVSLALPEVEEAVSLAVPLIVVLVTVDIVAAVVEVVVITGGGMAQMEKLAFISQAEGQAV